MRNRSFPDLNAPVVIIEGDNETGKSTFFHFLQTMLYGIYPVSEEKHPYAPRDGERMRGNLTMESDNGGQYTVTRLLRSTVTGELVWPDGRSETLGNRDVPLMHISKEVYEAMYALSLYDLVALQDKDKAWQAVQDRLVGGVGVDFIRPARSVVEELDDEAKTLWRSKYDRGSAAKKIAERQYALNGEISEAKKRDQKLRALSDQVAQYAQHDRDLSEERTKLRAEKRRTERLAPIRERLRQIDDTRRKAGDSSELAGIPDDPAAALEEIAREIGGTEQQRKQLESEREGAERILAAVEAGKGFDMDMRPGNPYDSLLRDRKRAENELERAQGQLIDKARDILTEPWDAPFVDILAGIAPAALRERIEDFEEMRGQVDARKQAEEVQKQAEALQRVGEGRRFDADAAHKALRNRAVVAGLFLAGAVVAIILGRMELAIGVGVAALLAGYMAWQAWVQGKRMASSPSSLFAPAPSLEEIEAEADQRCDDVRDLMNGLPVPESRLKRPDSTLFNDVKSLQDAVQMHRATRQRVEERMDELKEMALKEKTRIRKEHGDCKEAYIPLERRRQELETVLCELGDGDLEQGIAIATARKKEHQLAETLEEKLETDFAGEDMTKVRQEIESLEQEGVAWTVSDDSVIRLDDRLEELDAEINALTKKRAEAKKDIENLLEQSTLATLESEREQLESELKALEERHDRLRLLQHIIREADRRFREAHQPDVLRRASGYAQTITGGRYERFDYDEDERLCIYPAGDPKRSSTVRPWPVEAPLSQGTLDQIYLAIRFALVDHLDDGKESLPVFLDEVFVNWDRDRRIRCYDIFFRGGGPAAGVRLHMSPVAGRRNGAGAVGETHSLVKAPGSMFRFLHLADVHLDTTFHCRGEALRKQLRDALRRAFERAVDTAIDEAVHAVLIAGDLFDNERLSFETEGFLLGQLHRLDKAGIPCFYVTGNHDPSGKPPRGGKMAWPASFHLLDKSKPTAHDVRDASGERLACIVGAGHKTSKEADNLATSFPAADGSVPHVGLLHTQVTSADGAASHDRYAPCSIGDLQGKGYAYWALGHIHKRQQVIADPEAWYPGNIQGRHPGETDAKGGLLVEIDAGGHVETEFRPFAPIQWVEIVLDNLQDLHTVEDIRCRIAADFSVRASEDVAEAWMLRVRLQGRTPLAQELRDTEQRQQLEDILCSELDDVLEVEIKADRVAPAVDVDKHRGEPHLLGSVLDLMDAIREGREKLGDLAPPGDFARKFDSEEDREAYLRSLLQDLDAEAAYRLVRVGSE